MNRLTSAFSYSGEKRKRKRYRLFRTIVLALLAIGILWVVYVQWLIHNVQNRAPVQTTDVAIVLGAALWNDRPSPALRERLDQAYRLYETKQVTRIIVSGGLGANGSTITEAEGMRRYLTERGVPPEAVYEEGESTSTYENLRFSKRIMDREGWSVPVIVTHEYHGARAMDIARFVGFREASVSLTKSNVMWMPWHKARETLAYTKWIADKWLMRPAN